MTCVTMHLLNYVVKAYNFYYLLPELKDVSNIVMNSSQSRSNGRAIVVVVGPTALVFICQNVFDLLFANLHQIKSNLNPDQDYGIEDDLSLLNWGSICDCFGLRRNDHSVCLHVAMLTSHVFPLVLQGVVCVCLWQFIIVTLAIVCIDMRQCSGSQDIINNKLQQ